MINHSEKKFVSKHVDPATGELVDLEKQASEFKIKIGEIEPDVLPDGVYTFEVKDFLPVEQFDGSEKLPPCPCRPVRLEVKGDDVSKTIFDRFYLHNSVAWRIAQLFVSVGLDFGDDGTIPWDDLIGRTGNLRLGITMLDDVAYNKILRYLKS